MRPLALLHMEIFHVVVEHLPQKGSERGHVDGEENDKKRDFSLVPSMTVSHVLVQKQIPLHLSTACVPLHSGST